MNGYTDTFRTLIILIRFYSPIYEWIYRYLYFMYIDTYNEVLHIPIYTILCKSTVGGNVPPPPLMLPNDRQWSIIGPLFLSPTTLYTMYRLNHTLSLLV